MSDELKPCPFCGSPAELERGNDHHGEWFNLGCSRHWGKNPDETCPGARIWYTETELPEVEAVKRWNARAPSAERLAYATPQVDEARLRLARAETVAMQKDERAAYLAGARAMQEAAAKVAREQAVCGCNGEHGACMIDDPPLYIEELIRALDPEKVGG